MSIQAMSWVFDKAPSDLKPSETLTLLSLANHANGEGGHSYPSVGKMASETKLGESTVREALQSLVGRNIIEQTDAPTNRKPATWKFKGVADPGWEPTLRPSRGAESGTQESRGAESGGPESVARGAESGTLGVQNLAPNHHITVQNPPLKGDSVTSNHSARAREEENSSFDPVDIEDDGVPSSWVDSEAFSAPLSESTRELIQHHPPANRQNQRGSGSMAQSSSPPREMVSNQRNSQSQSNNNRPMSADDEREYREELAHPFWQGPEGRERGQSMTALYEAYPERRRGKKTWVAVAYRETIGEQADLAHGTDFYEKVWNRLHDWVWHWENEQTEDQWIPWLPSWLKKEKWDTVPGERRR